MGKYKLLVQYLINSLFSFRKLESRCQNGEMGKRPSATERVRTALKGLGDDVESNSVLEPLQLQLEEVNDIEIVMTYYKKDVDTLSEGVELSRKGTYMTPDMRGILLDSANQTRSELVEILMLISRTRRSDLPVFRTTVKVVEGL